MTFVCICTNGKKYWTVNSNTNVVYFHVFHRGEASTNNTFEPPELPGFSINAKYEFLPDTGDMFSGHGWCDKNPFFLSSTSFFFLPGFLKTPSCAWRHILEHFTEKTSVIVVCNSGYGSAITALIGLSENQVVKEDGKNKLPLPFAIFDGLSQNSQSKWLGYYKGFCLMLDRAFSDDATIPGFRHLCWELTAQLRKKSQELLEVPCTEAMYVLFTIMQQHQHSLHF